MGELLRVASHTNKPSPSQPNYIAAASGDIWGLADDEVNRMRFDIRNVTLTKHSSHSTIIYLQTFLLSSISLRQRIYLGQRTKKTCLGQPGWKTTLNLTMRKLSFRLTLSCVSCTSCLTYPYHIPPFSLSDGPSDSEFYYFRRKHSPLTIHDSVTTDPYRAARIRNFNDFAADVKADALPQWVFVTPNMVNDAHDTSIEYAGDWVEWWLRPLLRDERFNKGTGKGGTLIVLTFDENSVSCLVSSVEQP